MTDNEWPPPGDYHPVYRKAGEKQAILGGHARVCLARPPQCSASRWFLAYSIVSTMFTVARISCVPAAIGTDLASMSIAIARFILRGCGA